MLNNSFSHIPSVGMQTEQKIWNSIRPRDSKIPTNMVGVAWNVLQDLKTVFLYRFYHLK